MLFASDRRVKTVSVHCAGNYFSDKQISDLDVEMPPGCGDEVCSFCGMRLAIAACY